MLAMLYPLLALLPLLTPISASPALIERNLAYRSPYASHPSLGIDTHVVHARHLAARTLHERAVHDGAVKGPAGEAVRYPPGKGLGAEWSSDWVYGGDVNFTHSVASGDPFDYSVILWTRAVPKPEGRIDIPVCVTYKVYAGDKAEGAVVSEGFALTGPDVDYTVKVEATGLTASTKYSYVFANCAKAEQKSPVGRTRTAPGKLAENVPTQRFAVYSCSNYPNGFFSAYSGPVEYGDADYAIHLGDYIYEYGTGGAAIDRRPSKGRELASLDDYRRRYDQYRTDVDLVSLHSSLPIFAIWDDHEFANNLFKGGSSNSNDSLATGGCAYSNGSICFTERQLNAKRAYFEWIPIRQVDLADDGRIWRDFRFGDLLDVLALDSRAYGRDVTDLSYNVEYVAGLAVELESERSLLGSKQEEWLERRLEQSKERGTTWRMLMNQVILGTWTSQTPDKATFLINYDAWDGYQAARTRLLSHVAAHDIDNIIAITGDTHANWLFENNLRTTLQGSNTTASLTPLSGIVDSIGRAPGTVVEYAGTAVSSNGWGNSWGSYDNHTVGAERMVANNPSLLYSDAYHRGYMSLAINYTHIETSWWAYPGNQQARVPRARTLAMRTTQQAGKNRVSRPLMQPTFGRVKPGN